MVVIVNAVAITAVVVIVVVSVGMATTTRSIDLRRRRLIHRARPEEKRGSWKFWPDRKKGNKSPTELRIPIIGSFFTFC